MKSIFTFLATGVLFLYPFAIYFGLQYFEPNYLAVILLGLLISRVALLKSTLNKMPWVLPATVLGAIAILFSFWFDSVVGFKLYPVMVNVSMLAVFIYSYFKPPTVIETFARLTEKDFPERAVSYTVKVTLIWCLFFLLNGGISLYTALYTSFDTWLFYNGFLSYIAMATLMSGEYCVRKITKKQYQKSFNAERAENEINQGSSSNE